ncbi:MAG: sugar phosphate isomerase/epimerase [Candidatus Heimdallarchaeota archaeon]|nr:sugar phosphate isomerase/epimerase [Candidatus Heimdallarchaeota archaeon]
MFLKIGASLLLNFTETNSIKDFIIKVAQRGLKVVELVAEPPYCFLDSIKKEERIKIISQAKKSCIDLTVHATFSDINIAAINPNVRSFALSEIKKNIDFAQEINAKILTIHPGEYGASGITYPELTKKLNFESLEEISCYAEEKEVLIGLENMPNMPREHLEDNKSPIEIAKIIQEIRNKFLGITWDVGHSNTTMFSLSDFFINFKENLSHIHLHDNHGPGEGWTDTHLEIGKGTTNWKELFELLNSINFSKTMIFELKSWELIDNSISYLSKII